jgi:hypothetical protein
MRSCSFGTKIGQACLFDRICPCGLWFASFDPQKMNTTQLDKFLKFSGDIPAIILVEDNIRQSFYPFMDQCILNAECA